MKLRLRPAFRLSETLLLLFLLFITGLAFASLAVAESFQLGGSPASRLAEWILPVLIVLAVFTGLHALLMLRGVHGEQILLPLVGILFALGLVMIARLRGPDGVWQQLTRGFLPGMILLAVFVAYPRLIEHTRRLAIPISLVGLALPFATALFGVVDETGSRLALKIGPLPAIQTSEMIKVALIVFLAWFIEGSGEAVEGRALPVFGWLRFPAVRYLVPGLLFTALATLALVAMADFGAVLILALIFGGMLYAGFESRIFGAILAVGVALSLFAALLLSVAWEVPDVIQVRFLAYQNPWSNAEVVLNGQATGITISEGPGYQIQQAIYAVLAGGLSGRGLGLGSPDFIPLAASDFIFAAVIEELGALTGIAILVIFTILLIRILRAAGMLPRWQVYERLLLVGIAIHFFTQVIVMAGGTLNLIPMTGVTIPFMSQGGAALMVNLAEVGMVFALIQRMERSGA